MTEPSISMTRKIPASPGQIFSILTRPVVHPDVDGSGMLRTAIEDVVISKVGDLFAMNTFNDEMGNYVMENRVVEFERDRRIVWEPIMRSIDKAEYQSDIGEPAYQLWGWSLEPLDADHTRVTEFFDCRHSPEWLRNAVKEGERWRPVIEASLENLERLVTGS